ncbi:hypothetical protein TcasGA2_TC032330 [Tribolium castaneum]|uniref:C2H2-type domain-containing protein n=1 Tax=Tribolium castaneum TaxID=7070 RepID=A0A139WLH1_TRICA|nr:hypothetical protein TcasGA2_TC032330 [Tribolium castaneum]
MFAIIAGRKDHFLVLTVLTQVSKKFILYHTCLDDIEQLLNNWQSKVTTGTTKPSIKILAVEDLKNDTIVANIKKELSPHVLFGKKEQPKVRKIQIEEINLKEVKVEKVDDSVSKEKKKYPKIQKLSVERMKRFLAMNQETMPPPVKKPLACERDISLLKFPVDTLRCQHCEVLYERAKHSEHLSQCKKLPPKVKFGCTSYGFLSDQENRKIRKPKKHQLWENMDVSALSELFMCTKCTKTYRLKHSLTRHIRFECGKEPMYACRFCPRRFKHKYDLKVHEKSRHLQNPMALSADTLKLSPKSSAVPSV